MPFRLPTRVHFGSGKLDHVSSIVDSYDKQRILLVTDAGLKKTAWPGKIATILDNKRNQVTIVDSIEPNPRQTTVDHIANFARNSKTEIVIGLGGGSVLDAGKAIAMLLQNDGSILDFEGKNKFQHGSAPFIAIPTTCGTGSEVTWVSVINNPDARTKLSIKGDAMFPSEAIVDPDVLKSLPASLIAHTGMDAYTHAIEAYTGNCSNPFSDALAEKAIVLLNKYLICAVNDGENLEARTEVMRASTIAGMAFGNADVAGVHCLSESLGGLYDIPHGLANAILLVPVLTSHLPHVKHKFSSLYGIINPGNASKKNADYRSKAMLESIKQLTLALNIPPFDALAIPEEEYPLIASRSVTNNSNGSNPRPMYASDYLHILESMNG